MHLMRPGGAVLTCELLASSMAYVGHSVLGKSVGFGAGACKSAAKNLLMGL